MPNPSIVLHDGTTIPAIAFGTATRFMHKPCTPNIPQALNHGFRHINTAEMYQNEESVGEALVLWDGKREDVYITTKWGREYDDDEVDIPVIHPRDSLVRSLTKMKLDNVDLYLIHHPLEYIDRLSKIWTIIPAVNQVEHHPYVAHQPAQQAMIRACQFHGILVSPYTPCQVELKTCPAGPASEIIKKIADDKGWSTTQVLLAWAAQTANGPVITTTATEARLQEILSVFDGTGGLTQLETDGIAEAGKGLYKRQYDGDFSED